MKENLKSSVYILITLAIGACIALAGSQGGVTVASALPLFLLCVIIAFAINLMAFIPAYILQTEKFFDLTGGITYITVTVVAFMLAPVRDSRSLILTVLVIIWALRLSSFLFMRIHKEGKDGRFDELKPNFLRFLLVWILQGLWVTFTLAAALVAITSSANKSLDAFAIAGLVIWLFGFAIEVIADTQKSRWRAKPENKGKFINVGLWSKSRHPNYFGEIMLWIGVTIIALPVMQGWQFIALVSPVFVTLLLTRISGVPMLEERADKRWGGQDDYEKYKKDTPVLIPKF